MKAFSQFNGTIFDGSETWGHGDPDEIELVVFRGSTGKLRTARFRPDHILSLEARKNRQQSARQRSRLRRNAVSV